MTVETTYDTHTTSNEQYLWVFAKRNKTLGDANIQ